MELVEQLEEKLAHAHDKISHLEKQLEDMIQIIEANGEKEKAKHSDSYVLCQLRRAMVFVLNTLPFKF